MTLIEKMQAIVGEFPGRGVSRKLWAYLRRPGERQLAMNKIAACMVALLLLQLAPATSSVASESWRRITALQEFSVLTCLGDKGLFWIARSKKEERELFTPEFYEKCPSGTSRTRIWPCCDAGKHQIFRSRAELEEALSQMARDFAAQGLPENPQWKAAYLEEVDRLIPDFEEEALVLLSDVYGGTGMAKGLLDFSEHEGVLTVQIRVELPPPPLTPDTAVFYFAFAISKSKIRELNVLETAPAAPGNGT